MHRGRPSLLRPGNSVPSASPPRLSVRGAHGPITLGQIRDWVAGHAILIFRPVTLGPVPRLGRFVQRDSARFAQWANQTHRFVARATIWPSRFHAPGVKPSDTRAFPPQRGLRRHASALSRPNAQTASKLAATHHFPFQIWLDLRRTSQEDTQARHTGLGLVGRVLARVSGKLARPQSTD